MSEPFILFLANDDQLAEQQERLREDQEADDAISMEEVSVLADDLADDGRWEDDGGSAIYS